MALILLSLPRVKSHSSLGRMSWLANRFLKRSFISLLLLVLALPSALSYALAVSLAQEALALQDNARSDAYTIKHLEVDLPAGNTGRNREKAIELATEQGFKKLLRQLTPPNEWVKHTWLLSDLNINSLVSDVAIEDEQISPRYKLKVTLTFLRENVRDILGQAGIPFSEVTPLTVLVVPLFEPSPSFRVLWEEHNPWRDGLMDTQMSQGLANFTLPAGELMEMRGLSKDMAAGGAADALLALGERYNADAVIVATARLVPGRLQVRGDWYSARDDVAAFPAIAFSYPQQALVPQSELLASAATRLYEEAGVQWQQAGLVSADKPGEAIVRYAAKSAAELFKFTQATQALSAVFGIKPEIISSQESLYRLQYYGDFNQVKQQLAGAGYEIVPEGVYWRVIVTQNN